MLKYLIAFAFTYAFSACNSDEHTQSQLQAESLQETGSPQQQMPQQPSFDAEVSDEELETFIEASVEIQQVQAEAQVEMVAIVEDEGLELNTFNEIAQAMHAGQSAEELDVSPDELEKFQKASESISVIEKQIEEELTDNLEEEGMGIQRFQEINMALQQDPELQQRAQQLMQEIHQQAPPDPGGY